MKKLYTVTKGNSPCDAVTFDTDNVEETRADAPYVSVTLNRAISYGAIEEALRENGMDQ